MSLIGGIRPPIAVLSALLLMLAGVTALVLGRVDDAGVSGAVRTSQQHFAEDGANALRASIDESMTDLNRSAALFNAGKPVSADTVLDKLGNTYQKWMGTAVVEIRSGKLLAARGETVPLTSVDRSALGARGGLDPRMVRLQNGEIRLLSFALLSWPGEPQQLLVASNALKFPGISLGQFRSIAVVDRDGAVLSSDGIPEPEQVLTALQRKEVQASRKQLKDFAHRAARAAAQDPRSSKEPGSGGYQGVSGSLLGGSFLSDRSVGGYATLADPEPGETATASGLGLTVVATVKVAEDPGRTVSPVFGLTAAGVLLLIGGLAVAVLLGTVQRPLIRLFLEARRLSRADLARPVTVPGHGEARRIGAALERLRRQLLGEPAPGTAAGADAPRARGPRRLGSRALIAVSAALLLVWCVPLLLLLNRADGTAVVPQQLVNDQRERTDTLSDRLRRALNEGDADLESVAGLIGDRTGAPDMTRVLKSTMSEHPRYRSLYVVDASGSVLAAAGDPPRAAGPKPAAAAPLRLRGQGGKEPVVVGTAEIPGRHGAALVGEFRVEFLNSLLRRPGLGVVRLVDADGHEIAGNTGFRAFQALPDQRLRDLVAATGLKMGKSAHAGGVLYRENGVQIAAAAPFAGGGPAKALGWSVVSWQPADRLAIPEYDMQNRTVLAGLLGAAAAAACLGWLHIVVVRPLRVLAGQAEALADGDRRTVLFPRHHDEVGAVTRSLELIRQQLQDQRRQQPRTGAPGTGPARPGTNDSHDPHGPRGRQYTRN
ncbi:cache and HAMP domain-containing protein [Streptomyces sp. J2-1]|uniref:HAMP domain-containing protein n=1 Tax=Streptomyces corallincola TaxID=2851888 RepID=UPI001C381A1A|nr:cache and HAMP domain-containing protein [Streptomyces corallincola]MBV2357937.1 cache and HAMP domain-containing protein [Streptomyces corallincola]